MSCMTMTEGRNCTMCGLFKATENFYVNRKGYVGPRCKQCYSIVNRRRRSELPVCSVSDCGRVGNQVTDGIPLCNSHKRNGVEAEVRIKRTADEILYRNRLGEKHCIRCDRWLRVELFQNDATRPDGLQCFCRRCMVDAMHHLTIEHRDILLQEQGGRCAGPDCNHVFDPYSGPRATYHIDHDHDHCPGKKSCGQCIRFLLCQKCNLQARTPIHHAKWLNALPLTHSDRSEIRSLLKVITDKLAM